MLKANRSPPAVPPGTGATVDRIIGDYIAPTGGTYYALVTGPAGSVYRLVVTRGAAFGAGDNVSFATAEEISGTAGALGAVTTAAPEGWYAIDLPADSQLELQTYTPGGSDAQFVNSLSPLIELYSPTGDLLASGGGTGNPSLAEPIFAAGSYRIRVLSAEGTTGEYFLSATIDTDPPQVTAVYAGGGADWSPAFDAFLAASGSGDGQLGYRLLGGGGQLLTLPWTNITTLSVVFSQDVSIDTAAANLALFGSPDLPAPPDLGGRSSATTAPRTRPRGNSPLRWQPTSICSICPPRP